MALKVLTTVEALHAPVIVEALEAAGLEIEVVAIEPFAQLDYFRRQRVPLVEVRVDETELAHGRAALAQLEEEAHHAARIESEAPGTADAVAEQERSPSSRTPWIVGAALAVLAIAVPPLVRARSINPRSWWRGAHHATDARIRAPSAAEQVEPELRAAGVR